MDLSHYDFVEDFSLDEMGSLIAGFDPKLPPSDEFAARIDTIRRTLITSVLMSNGQAAMTCFDGGLRQDLPVGLLYSTQALLRLKCTNDPDELPFGDGFPTDYWEDIPLDEARFSRDVVHNWLAGRRFKSGYDFDPAVGLMPPHFRQMEDLPHESESAGSIAISHRKTQIDIDPADLPDELSAANIAFRAVTNGYGDGSSTFKSRLIDYLVTHFTTFNNEAVQRIATVANPDKAPGRKKRNAE